MLRIVNLLILFYGLVLCIVLPSYKATAIGVFSFEFMLFMSLNLINTILYSIFVWGRINYRENKTFMSISLFFYIVNAIGNSNTKHLYNNIISLTAFACVIICFTQLIIKINIDKNKNQEYKTL